MEGKGSGDIGAFFDLAHHHVTTCVPVQIYTNSHMIAELAELRISANVPTGVRSGIWE